MKRVVAIIVAGGGGKRMGGDLPKQFLPLGGRPLLDRTLSAFTSSARVDGVILALPPAFPDGAEESYRAGAEGLAAGAVRNAACPAPPGSPRRDPAGRLPESGGGGEAGNG